MATSALEDFASRLRTLEALQRSSGQMLRSFQQNLEFFRRPSVVESSAAVKEILERNKTLRLSRYIEAGCRHPSSDKKSVSELHVAINALWDHVSHVDTHLKALKQLLDSGTESLIGTLGDQTFSTEDGDLPDGSQTLEAMNVVTTMALVYSMFEDDYVMQARVIGDLSLEVSSETLESYCMLWTLRPFIDEEVLRSFLAALRVPGIQ